MLKITGLHTCSRCGKEFKWEYQPSAWLGGGQTGLPDEIDFSVNHPRRINSLSERYAELQIECGYCYNYDRFVVDTLDQNS